MNYWTAAKMIGGGNVQRGMMTIRALARGCKLALKKHPVFAEGKYHALGVIGEEYRELERAVERGKPGTPGGGGAGRTITAIRFVQREHEHEVR